jgi:O-antigen/teichoic acid export membrane protein
MSTPGGEGARPEELKKAAIAGVRWMSLARVASEVIAFGAMIALARLIGPTGFGQFAIVLVMREIALTITGEGIGTALVQRPKVERAHVQAGMFMSLAIGCMLAAIAFVTAPLIFTPLFDAETAALVQLSTPMFIVAATAAVPQAVLQRRLDFRLLGLIQILSGMVGAGASLALAIAGMEAEALVLGGLIASVTTMLVLLWCVRPPWPRPQLRAAREIARFGVPAALAGLSWTGFRNADFAIVGARLGTAGVGYYWRGYQFAIEYQRKVGAAVHQVAFPLYSRTGGLAAMLAFRERVVRVVSVVLIPGLAALAVLAPVLVPWMLGDEWEPAVVPTQILALAGMVTVLSDTLGAVVLAAGRAKGWLAYHLGCFAIYAAAVYVAAGAGLAAVCWAVVGVQAMATVAGYGLLLRGLIERPLLRLWHDLLPGATAAAALIAVTAPVSWALAEAGVHPAVHLAVSGAAGAAACLAVVRIAAPAAWHDLSGLSKRVVPRLSRRRPLPTPVATAKTS